jgi:hypothetical protein
MVGKRPRIFSRDYRQFYNRYNEPTHVKYVKIDILSGVADAGNVADIITELSEYVTDVDQELARRSIRAIADIAVSNNFSVGLPVGYPNGPDAYNSQAAAQAMSAMQDQIVDTMVDFLEMNLDYVRDESLVVMKDLLRKYPEKRHDVLDVLPRIITSVQQSQAKAAIVWLIGEFGQDMRRAPYVLEKLIDDFSEETSPTVLLELLTSALKLFFKRPPEMQSMLGRLLQSAINDSNHQDVRDRALLYYRLLERQSTEQAAAIVAQFRTEEAVHQFTEMVESDLREKLFQEFNTLAVVYNKPSELFIAQTHLAAPVADLGDEDEEDDGEGGEEEDEEDYGSHQQQQYNAPAAPAGQRSHQAPPAAAPSMDLLDMDFGGSSGPAPPATAAPVLTLVPNPVIDAASFQAKWTNCRVVDNIAVQLPQIASQSEIEQAFAANRIFTMASGDVGPQFKFFFYAQDAQDHFYLAETLIEKAERVLRATVKGENDFGGAQFSELVKRVLLG